MTIASLLIRPMSAADPEPAADLLRRGDFGDRLGFFHWAIGRPTIRAFVAEDDGRIIGTGVASAHGHAGWVGVIYVDPAFRGGGLGRRITRTVIDHLEANGVRSMVLIASPMGRPVYEREGFTVLDRQVRFTIDGLSPADTPPDPRLRPFAPRDLAAVLELDREVTGEDRSSVLRELVEPVSTTVALGPDGGVRGFLVRAPWRGGAVIAPDPDDALRLLERRRHSTGVSGKAGAGVLASNEAGRARLRAAGWEEELGGVRMIRGETLDWNPDGIWGQLNGALG
jgi:ribosomal protein S18 acetylase RimI-like enzyme